MRAPSTPTLCSFVQRCGRWEGATVSFRGVHTQLTRQVRVHASVGTAGTVLSTSPGRRGMQIFIYCAADASILSFFIFIEKLPITKPYMGNGWAEDERGSAHATRTSTHDGLRRRRTDHAHRLLGAQLFHSLTQFRHDHHRTPRGPPTVQRPPAHSSARARLRRVPFAVADRCSCGCSPADPQ